MKNKWGLINVHKYMVRHFITTLLTFMENIFSLIMLPNITSMIIDVLHRCAYTWKRGFLVNLIFLENICMSFFRISSPVFSKTNPSMRSVLIKDVILILWIRNIPDHPPSGRFLIEFFWRNIWVWYIKFYVFFVANPLVGLKNSTNSKIPKFWIKKF